MIDEKTLADVRAQHPYAIVAENGEDVAVFRLPTRVEQREYKRKKADEVTAHTALEELVVLCRVWPTREEFTAMLDRRAFLTDSFGHRILMAAGAGEAKEVKK